MALPSSLDPVMVTLAAKLVRRELSASQHASLPPEQIEAIVERTVEKFADAGLYARDGGLFLPHKLMDIPIA